MTQLSREQIHDTVAEQLQQILAAPPASIEPTARLVEDLGVDSLSLLELVIGIEEQFGVRISDADVAGMVTVGDAVDLVAAAV